MQDKVEPGPRGKAFAVGQFCVTNDERVDKSLRRYSPGMKAEYQK